MRDGLLVTERVQATQEEVARSLIKEVVAPTGEYHRQYNFGQL
jgi:hypothetical protein